MKYLLLVTCLVACSLFQSSIAAQTSDTQTVAPQAIDSQTVLEKYRTNAVRRWEDEIQKLETRDKTERYPSDAVLFIGSSSIRLWKSIADDMNPYIPIRRGYGGAKFTDLAVFADRLISPHSFKALVVFVANDVKGAEDDTPLDELKQLVNVIIATGQKHQPQAPVFLIEVTPSSSRFDAWEKIRNVNRMLRDLALTTPNVHFIATAEHYLNDQKQPQDQLFIDDQLHLNSDGYRLWSKIIKRSLDDFVKEN